MKLSFLGATHEVTGSCFLLQANGKNILIDCGMEQGRDVFENADIPVSAADIDCVLLTHAHIDHSGKLPLLYVNGFRGDIFATDASTDLCSIMLRDSAHIQEAEAEWRNRKAKRSGKDLYAPPYTINDAEATVCLFRPCVYGTRTQVSDGVEINFVDAGHLLGSASIEVFVSEGGISKKLVFSGDIGNMNKPILRNPQYIKDADYVITESTYGNRSHGDVPDYITAFTQIIQKTLDRGGNLVIPSFAVGRTQELLYFIRDIKEKGLVHGHGDFPVYVDSPLAVEATRVFDKNWQDCFDDETRAIIAKGINPLLFPGLKMSVTSDESRAINFDTEPKVIISASGMCEAGRIRHHLKHNLWRRESTILFVGYQADGTLGRALLEGEKEIKLFGETINIRAEVTNIAGVSGHADDKGLLRWMSAFENKPQRVFVVHGDEGAVEYYAETLRNELKLNVYAPYSGDSWDLVADTQVDFGTRKRIEQKSSDLAQRPVSAVFARLLAAADRLTAMIKRSSGRTNKDLSKLTDHINSLCDKWDK